MLEAPRVLTRQGRGPPLTASSPSALRHCQSGFRAGVNRHARRPGHPEWTVAYRALCEPRLRLLRPPAQATLPKRYDHLPAWDVTAAWMNTRDRPDNSGTSAQCGPAGRAKARHRRFVGVGGTIP
jgi:hypothetical protein